MENITLEQINNTCFDPVIIDNLFPPQQSNIIPENIESTPIIENNHWTLDTRELLNFIRLAKIIGMVGKDITCKAVHIRPLPNNTVDLITADTDIYLKVNIPLKNCQNLLSEPVNIPTEVLSNLLKLAGVTFNITKKDKKYYIVYSDGEIPFDTFTFPPEKFNMIEPTETLGVVNSNILINYIKNVAPLISASVLPQEKRVLINSKGAYTSHLATLMRGNIFTTSDMDIKIKDMNILRGLLPEDTTPLTILKEGKFRHYIQSEKFTYSFVTSSSKIPDKLMSEFDSLTLTDPIIVDYKRLSDIAELSANLMSSVGLLGLRVDANTLIVEFRTKNNEIKNFKLPCSKPIQFTKEIEIQSKLLRLILSSFMHESEVAIHILEKGLLVQSKELQAVAFLF